MRWRFGDFTLDLETRQLRRDAGDVHLSPKAFDLLAFLISKRPSLVGKNELIEHVWSDTFVVEANLSNLVSEIRAALGDAERASKFIRTVHRLGYAFDGDASEDVQGNERSRSVIGWIEWRSRRFPLGGGVNVIGRQKDAAVMLDSLTVSRRHAAVVVSAEATVLEDFGSRNGTFIGELRVTAPTPLRDGDIIRIGEMTLTYREESAGNSTESYAIPNH